MQFIPMVFNGLQDFKRHIPQWAPMPARICEAELT